MQEFCDLKFVIKYCGKTKLQYELVAIAYETAILAVMA